MAHMYEMVVIEWNLTNLYKTLQQYATEVTFQYVGTSTTNMRLKKTLS
jgi:hypothetical protein